MNVRAAAAADLEELSRMRMLLWPGTPEEENRHEVRGKGIGRLLMERAATWAGEQGCTELGSDTWIENEPSQRAHEALGFEVVDRCVNYRMVIGTVAVGSQPRTLAIQP